jgi:hypothetical protein
MIEFLIAMLSAYYARGIVETPISLALLNN